MRKTIFFIGAFVALISCGEPPFFEETRTFEPQEWPIDQELVFTFDIDDTQQAYDFLLNLRHGEAYPYANLYLFMQLDFPNGKRSIDTLECVLADPRGKWNGRTPGSLVDHRIIINGRRIFPLKGEYTVHIKQAMRQDPLPEIFDVGFALEEYIPQD